MKRTFDIIVASSLILLLALPMALIALMIKMSSKGAVLYWSRRVGADNQLFMMPKFRTMLVDTPTVATHLLADASNYLVPGGRLLRGASLDELPQLFSVILGDMSLVGPRPALFNQYDLIARRTELGIHRLLPGITGWAQVNGRDDIALDEKIRLDQEYLQRFSFGFDVKISWLTIFKVLSRDGISH